MANVNVTWTVADQSVPAPTDLMQYQVSIVDLDEQFVAFGTLTATFEDVGPGDYVAQVALSNADGSHRDFVRERAFSVPAPTVTLAAPDVVTVSL